MLFSSATSFLRWDERKKPNVGLNLAPKMVCEKPLMLKTTLRIIRIKNFFTGCQYANSCKYDKKRDRV